MIVLNFAVGHNEILPQFYLILVRVHSFSLEPSYSYFTEIIITIGTFFKSV